MPDSLRTETPATTTIPTPAGASATMTMKANGKEKTPIIASSVAAEQDQSLEASTKQTDQAEAKDSSIASTADSEGSVDDSKDSATTQPTVDQDEEMKEASPITTDVIEEDTPMTEPAPVVKPRDLPGIPEGIDQEDLDGGLLDGALDDYDDLDQDTEDTEVGNGEDDFSDDDDDDDDDDLDGPLLNSTDKVNHDSDAHVPGVMSHADTAKSEDPDSDDEMDQDERDEALQTEDSDSDLGDLDASDNDQDDDDDDDDEGDADGEDGDDDEEEEEEEEEIKPPIKKDTVLSQKPTLHRPSITEEELKDSGDELSDLSEFDDTDDSDEDDNIPEPKPVAKEVPSSAPPPAPTSGEKTGSATASITGPTPAAATTAKPTLGGRKRSLHETTVEPLKPEDESIKSEQDEQAEVPIPSGRARLSEPGSRKRRVSEAEDTQPSDKESESEVADEEEEETEKTTREEDEDEGEEDHEMKQLHKDALDALTSIEIEFANLRDKMYEERLMELDREVEMINDGTHPELSSLMQEIEQKREHRLHIADMGRKYKTDIAQSAFDIAEYQAHCTFQSARRNIRTRMVHDMGKKQRQLILELTLSSDSRKRKRPRNDVEIYVDGSRCMVDGIWYKPNDAVVVLDATIGKYHAKYITLEADWIVLQRTDGSKTRLHLGLFRGRKLCMQPKA
ncbi:hypothetical protein EC991_006421 [Linnemannia zychae]|nr:hypothetical protein EC991_006421 [Linnemannia zychae]